MSARRRLPIDDARRQRLVIAAVSLAVLVIAGIGYVVANEAADARVMYEIGLASPYAGYRPSHPGFPYSPLVAQLLQPLQALPWPVFHAIIVGGELAALAWLIGLPLAALLAFVQAPLLVDDLRVGNIQLMVTALVVIGFTRPPAWAGALLTKVSPGIGLLWFVERREWRRVALAIGTTAALALVSFTFAPQLWFDWFHLLTGSPLADAQHLAPLPFVARIAVGAAVVLVAAISDRAWLVPLGMAIATPEYGSQWLILLAMPRLFFHRPAPGELEDGHQQVVGQPVGTGG
jgi:hypothetical protein